MASISDVGALRYDDSIESVIKFRTDPRKATRWWGAKLPASGWMPMYNSITGLRLTVTDDLIEVHGMGPFARGRIGKLFGFKSKLESRSTTMTTVRLGRVVLGAMWESPWPKSDYLVLSQQSGDGSTYSLAVGPSDHDFDRLGAALRSAGVREI